MSTSYSELTVYSASLMKQLRQQSQREADISDSDTHRNSSHFLLLRASVYNSCYCNCTRPHVDLCSIT